MSKKAVSSVPAAEERPPDLAAALEALEQENKLLLGQMAVASAPAAQPTPEALAKLTQENEALRQRIKQLTSQPEPGTLGTEPDQFLIIFNNRTSSTTVPSVQKGHAGYSVPAKGYLSLMPADAKAEKHNQALPGMVKRGWITVKYSPTPQDVPDVVVAGYADLGDKQRWEVLEIVFGPSKNAERLTHGRMTNLNNVEDRSYYEQKYVPMLKVAREYLKAQKAPEWEQRVQWITEHLATLNNINL